MTIADARRHLPDGRPRLPRRGEDGRVRAAAGVIVGTPVQVTEQLRRFMALGVDYVVVATPHFPDEATLALLCDDVLRDGEVRRLDLARYLKPGDANTIRLEMGWGGRPGSAVVAVGG